MGLELGLMSQCWAQGQGYCQLLGGLGMGWALPWRSALVLAHPCTYAGGCSYHLEKNRAWKLDRMKQDGEDSVATKD